MFPLNTWYVAARSEEIPADKPLGRRICNQPMAFFRNSAGVVAAVLDFCPHRGAPLSLGFVEGDTLVCGYHGLAMGCDGKTVSMPCQRVRGFPAVAGVYYCMALSLYPEAAYEEVFAVIAQGLAWAAGAAETSSREPRPRASGVFRISCAEDAVAPISRAIAQKVFK